MKDQKTPSLFPIEVNFNRPAKPSLELAWEQIKNRLRTNLDEKTYQTWIEPLAAISNNQKEVVIHLPNLVVYQGIHNNFLSKIELAKQELGLQDMLIRFELTDSEAFDGLMESGFDGQTSTLDASEYPEMHNRPFEQETTQHSSQQPGDDQNWTPPSQGETAANSLFDEPSAHDQGQQQPPQQPAAPAQSPVQAPVNQQGQGFSRSLTADGNLNRNYIFDTFVKGDSNQFAVATCLSAAENPGKAYNPLFIYGSTGLGKTHLLHAVGNRVLEFNPNAVVTYITSERFMNEMIYCLRFNKMWDFRQKYRNCDVFLVDDIQFISNKKATQEEFFHTFNTLYAAKKQIVITSDLFPKDIPDIEDRLRNRFQWGLIADIQPPSIEHRIAILLTKADKLGMRLSPDVAEYIARHAKRNVRELEGALHRINAFSALQGETITMELAVHIFKDVLGEPPKRLTIETVQKLVADHFKLRVADLKSKKRQRALALPRQIAMYLSRKLTNASFPEIGDKFGGKDHTTVMHNVKKIENTVTRDLDLKAHVETLERQLEQIQ